MKTWAAFGLLTGLAIAGALATYNIWQQLPTDLQVHSFNNALLSLDELREVATPEPLRQALDEVVSATTNPLTNTGVLLETNKHRAITGLPALSSNKTLDSVALTKVRDMFARQYFEHDAPTGEGVADLVAKVKYDYIRVGENLALGNFADDAALVQAWMDSPGHRENILNAGYSEIGLAAAKGEFEGHTTWLAVQTFGHPLSACPGVDNTLQQKISDQQEYLNTASDELVSEAKIIEAENKALKKLVAKISELRKKGNDKINEGNAKAQSEGNEAAQPYWDEGAEYHRQADEKEDEYNERQATQATRVENYNDQVAAQSAANSDLEILIDKVNAQVKAFNACLEK